MHRLGYPRSAFAPAHPETRSSAGDNGRETGTASESTSVTTPSPPRPTRRARPWALLCLLLCLAAPLFADPAPTTILDPLTQEAIIEVFDQDLSKRLEEMKGWHTTKVFLLTTTIAVTFFGAVVVVLQTFKRVWTRAAAAILGILITTLTAINTSVFQHDYKTYDNRINESHKLATRVQIELIQLRQVRDSQLFAERVERFRELFDELMDLGKGMTPLPPLFATLIDDATGLLVPSAYAGTSGSSMEIEAKGIGRSLDAAKEQAWRNWRGRATKRLEGVVDTILSQAQPTWKQLPSSVRARHTAEIAASLVPLRRVMDTRSDLVRAGEYSFEIRARFDLSFIERTVSKIPVPAPEPMEPAMVRVPSGCFQMGTPNAEPGRFNDERLHRVCIDGFEIGAREVSFAEYDAFASDTGREPPDDAGWGRGDRPVINVSWNDAVDYAEWLSNETGKRYRLPTEAEWEYAARAGTGTTFWSGDCIDSRQANFDSGQRFAGCPAQGGRNQGETLPVGSLSKNPWGLYNVLGNVWEWTCSAYAREYDGNEQRCASAARERVRRGGSWSNSAQHLRSGRRYSNRPSHRTEDAGFRLARG